jgi:hypothetical protein
MRGTKYIEKLDSKELTAGKGEEAVDVTDLIASRGFPRISSTLFRLIEEGSARLEIKESHVKLFFKSADEYKKWARPVLSVGSDPLTRL